MRFPRYATFDFRFYSQASPLVQGALQSIMLFIRYVISLQKRARFVRSKSERENITRELAETRFSDAIMILFLHESLRTSPESLGERSSWREPVSERNYENRIRC